LPAVPRFGAVAVELELDEVLLVDEVVDVEELLEEE